MVQHFGAAPYGWPERSVRAGLLALLRGRWLTVRLADGAVVRKQDDPRCENWITGTQLFNKGVLEIAADPPSAEELGAPHKAPRRPSSISRATTRSKKLERRAEDLFPEILKRAQAAHADLSEHAPGATQAKVFVDVFTAVCEVEQATGRLNLLLQKAREKVKAPKTEVDALSAPMKVVRATETLRAAQSLDAMRDLRRRVRAAYATWAQRGGSAIVKGKLDALRTQVDDPSLLEETEAAKIRDDKVFPAYAADYQTRHAARNMPASTKPSPRWLNTPSGPRSMRPNRIACARTSRTSTAPKKYSSSVATEPRWPMHGL